MKKFVARKRTVVLSAIAVLAIAGAAIAYWTTTGSGVGSAQTGTTSNVIVHQVGSPTNLYPGGPTQPLDFNIENPGTVDQRVNQVTAVVTNTNAAGCANNNYTIAGSPKLTGDIITHGATSATYTGITIKMDETGVDQNACKNANLTIAFSAS
jgi:hypothetical protein